MTRHRLRPRPPAWLRRPRRTARFRLAALYGGLFLVSGAALVAATYTLFERLSTPRTPRLPDVPHAPALQDLNLATPLGKALPQLGTVQVQLTRIQSQLGAQGYSSSSTPSLPLGPKLVQAREKLAKDQHQLTKAVHQLAEAVHRMSTAGSAEAAQRAADSHQLLVDSGIALAVVAVLAVLTGWLVAGRMLRPIRTITRTAQRISSASLHERLALDGPDDELKQLGDTLDDLFGRLEAAFDAQRHFVANASHELRTPVTVERSLLQVALDDPQTSAAAWRSTAEELLASNDEQGRLIESLLTLASSEGGVDEHESVDLAGIARAVVLDRLDRLGRDREHPGLDVVVSFAPAPLEGDPRLLECLVGNLVDNAITHNVEDGRLEVSTGTREGATVVAVSNSGPVVPEGEVDRLFQPFQRLDRRRLRREQGHGLGLSIVRAVAAAHGATITASPLARGGLSIEVAFPPDGCRPGRNAFGAPGRESVTRARAPVLTG